jgi:hypothetical protein
MGMNCDSEGENRSSILFLDRSAQDVPKRIRPLSGIAVQELRLNRESGSSTRYANRIIS